MGESIEDDRKNLFKEVVRNVENCAELVIKYLRGEERNTQLEELKAVMLEYCELDHNWKQEKRTLGELDKILKENNIDERDDNKVDEMLENLRKKGHKKSDSQRHDWYINLENKIEEWIAAEDPDCDVVDEGSTESTLDPFTKRQIMDPVKNTCCGHSYDKETVTAMLSKKTQLRCPVVGCAYPGFFNKDHLEENKEMKRMLRNLSES